MVVGSLAVCCPAIMQEISRKRKIKRQLCEDHGQRSLHLQVGLGSGDGPRLSALSPRLFVPDFSLVSGL